MKKVLIFIGGMVTGFFAGFICGEKKNTRIMEVIPVEPPKETAKTGSVIPEKPKLDQLVAKYRVKETDYVQYSDGQSTDSGLHDRSVEAKETDENPRESVLYPTDDEPNQEEDDEEDTDEVVEEMPEVKFSKPEIMTRMEFENEKKHYDTKTLIYYTFDDTVCDPDDGDSVVVTPEDLIGEDALVCFGMGSQDPNIVYICNDKTSTKYEIVKLDASYSESILGLKYQPKTVNKSVRREDSDFD